MRAALGILAVLGGFLVSAVAFIVVAILGMAAVLAVIWMANVAYRAAIGPLDSWLATNIQMVGPLAIVVMAVLVFFVLLAAIAGSEDSVEPSGLSRPEKVDLDPPFPPLDRRLVRGTSPVFRVIVRGENLLMSFGKAREKFFLEQHVVVNAPTYLSACKRAIELVKCDRRLSAHLQNRADDHPRYYIGAVKQVRAKAGKNKVDPPIWTPEADYA